MITKNFKPGEIERKVHDLAKAMNRVRSAQADRDDVVVEMKHAKISRLELLAEDLKPVFDDIPAGNEQFEFSLMNAETPRLWIDMTSFVRMGRDGREYEFVKDTHIGRTILGRDVDRKLIGEHVTSYVAERILERERMMEGEWVSLSKFMLERGQTKDLAKEPTKEPTLPELIEEKSPQEVKSASLGYLLFTYLIWYVLGLVSGAVILFGLAWFDLLDEVLHFARQLMGSN